MRRLGELARGSDSSLRVDALLCVASIITVEPPDTGDLELLSQLEDLFARCLSPDPLEQLLTLTRRHPFLELRHTVLRVYAALAQHAWGQQVSSTYARTLYASTFRLNADPMIHARIHTGTK